MSRLVELKQGVSRHQGGRPYQEDDFAIADENFQSNGLALFSVFDGHGGAAFSKHAAQHVPQLVASSAAFRAGRYDEALKEAFLQEDHALHKDLLEERKNDRGGTTATVVLIAKDVLYAANVGDSSAILARKQEQENTYNAVLLSKDHKVDDDKEKKRLSEADAVVREDRVVTAGHAINMSRALGDFDFKLPKNDASADWISPVPHLAKLQLTPADDFIVIASDGLWNSYDQYELIPLIADMRKSGSTPQQICDAFTSKCGQVAGSDNVTMILIDLQWR